MGIPYVGPLPSKVGDLQSAYIYATEAEFSSAPAGSSGHINVDTLTNWPTIWNLPFFKGPAVYPFTVSSLSDAGNTEVKFTQYLFGDTGDLWLRTRFYYPGSSSYDPWSDWKMFASSLMDPVGLFGEEPYVPTWDRYGWVFSPLSTEYNDTAANGSIARRRSGGRVSVGTPMADDDAVTKVYVDDLVAGVETGGGMVGVPTFIRDTEPDFNGPAIWYQTSDGVVIKKWVQLTWAS